jgi:hypothetical protein
VFDVESPEAPVSAVFNRADFQGSKHEALSIDDDPCASRFGPSWQSLHQFYIPRDRAVILDSTRKLLPSWQSFMTCRKMDCQLEVNGVRSETG